MTGRSVLASFAAAVLAAGLAGACKSTEPLTACQSAGEELSVSSANPPRFSWSPGCLLSRIEVEDSTATTIWSVQADTANGIAPVVTYGVMPAGATSQAVAPVPLVSGHRYALGVFRYMGGGLPPDSVELLGATTWRQP